MKIKWIRFLAGVRHALTWAWVNLIKRPCVWTWRMLVKLIKFTWAKVKALGWFWGSLAALIAGVIFYSPSIALLILGAVTKNPWYSAAAWGYVIFWFQPIFSPALATYGVILIGVISVFNLFKKWFKHKKKGEHHGTQDIER